MHQPADVGRQLLRLGPRQEHAIVERVQETALRYPFLLIDENPVHDGDLPGRSAKTQAGDAPPDAEGLAKGHAMASGSRGGGRAARNLRQINPSRRPNTFATTI